MPQQFELIILAIEAYLPILSRGLPYLRKFLEPQKITIVGSRSCLDSVRELGLTSDGVNLLDEDRVVPGLSLSFVRSIIEQRGGEGRRAGWYFKQITNLAYAARSETWTYYLTWDADTIPVRPIRFFDDAGRTLLTKKSEYHKPYFDTIARLVGLERAVDFSFIAEHMLFDRQIVRELIGAVMGGGPSAGAFDGGAFARRILDAVADEDLSSSGFAEYETYGTYAWAKRPERVAARSLPSMRHGTAFFGYAPSRAQLFAISTRYFWASFESWRLDSLTQKLKKLAARVVGAFWLVAALVVKPAGYRRFTGGRHVR